MYLSNTKHDANTSKIQFLTLLSLERMSKFRKRVFMYAMPIQVQTKEHFKILQFLVVTYVIVSTLCYRRCPNGSGYFSLLKQF